MPGYTLKPAMSFTGCRAGCNAGLVKAVFLYTIIDNA